MLDWIKKRIPLFISICLIVITLGLYQLKLPFLERMEQDTYDLRFLYRGAINPGNEISLIVIDEKSLDEIGRWEWPRSIIIEFMHKLKKYNPRVIGFDIAFSEPDQHSELKTIDSIIDEAEKFNIANQEFYDYLNNKATKADTDTMFSRAIKDAGNIVTGYFYHRGNEGLDGSNSDVQFEEHTSKFEYPFYTQTAQSGKIADFNIEAAHALEMNLPQLTSASNLSGYFNINSDEDGTVRAIHLVTRYKDHFLIPLALQVLRGYLDYPETELRFHESGIEKIRLGDIDIPCDPEGNMFINYRGKQKTFKHYSFTDVLHDRLPLNTLADKIVLVGATATAIYDIRNTPFDKVFPGLEVHANIIDTILRGDFLSQSQLWVIVINLLIITGMGLFTGIVLPRFKAISGAVFTIAVFTGYIFAACAVFNYYRLLLSIIYPVLVLLLTYLAITAYRYMIEEREKRKIKAVFQHYLAPSVIEEIMKNPGELKLGGKEKELSVLFCDIRDFTGISEKLSPSQIERLLNEYLTAMTSLVFKHGGTLDKYMGDSIMAFFGAPLDQPDHHLRACLTATGMVEELKLLQEKWKKRGLPFLNSGIGVNSGPMVVGNMGSDSLFDYTVIGDNVNPPIIR